jgi:Aldo/keto reductase family
MEQRCLGRTGVPVSKLCLGAMMFGAWGEPNHTESTWIIRGVEDSLRRLNTDWIDLYQIHRPDPNTDIDETLAALSPTSSRRATSDTSGTPPSPPPRSSRRNGRPATAVICRSAASSRPTRSSPAGSSTTFSPPVRRTGSA